MTTTGIPHSNGPLDTIKKLRLKPTTDTLLAKVGTMVGAKSVETDVLMGNPRSFAAEITRKGRDRDVDAIVMCVVGLV